MVYVKCHVNINVLEKTPIESKWDGQELITIQSQTGYLRYRKTRTKVPFYWSTLKSDGVLVNLRFLHYHYLEDKLWFKCRPTHNIGASMNFDTTQSHKRTKAHLREVTRKKVGDGLSINQDMPGEWHQCCDFYSCNNILSHTDCSSSNTPSFISASRRPRIPRPGTKQRHPTEEEIPLYTKKATAHQQIKTAVHSEAKCILLMVMTRKDIFTFCECVCSHCSIIGSRCNCVMFKACLASLISFKVNPFGWTM